MNSPYLRWTLDGPYRKPSRLSRICNWFAWLLSGEPR